MKVNKKVIIGISIICIIILLCEIIITKPAGSTAAATSDIKTVEIDGKAVELPEEYQNADFWFSAEQIGSSDFLSVGRDIWYSNLSEKLLHGVIRWTSDNAFINVLFDTGTEFWYWEVLPQGLTRKFQTESLILAPYELTYGPLEGGIVSSESIRCQNFSKETSIVDFANFDSELYWLESDGTVHMIDASFEEKIVEVNVLALANLDGVPFFVVRDGDPRSDYKSSGWEMIRCPGH